jgi:hypothetical protein
MAAGADFYSLYFYCSELREMNWHISSELCRRRFQIETRLGFLVTADVWPETPGGREWLLALAVVLVGSLMYCGMPLRRQTGFS